MCCRMVQGCAVYGALSDRIPNPSIYMPLIDHHYLVQLSIYYPRLIMHCTSESRLLRFQLPSDDNLHLPIGPRTQPPRRFCRPLVPLARSCHRLSLTQKTRSVTVVWSERPVCPPRGPTWLDCKSPCVMGSGGRVDTANACPQG